MLIFSSSSCFFFSKFIEDSISCSLCGLLLCLKFITSLLLLSFVSSDKLFFIFFEFFLPFKKCILFIERKNHILFDLFLFHFVDFHHFMVFLDHFVDNCIYLITFFNVFILCFNSQLFSFLHLLLNLMFSINHLHGLISLSLSKLLLSLFISS